MVQYASSSIFDLCLWDEMGVRPSRRPPIKCHDEPPSVYPQTLGVTFCLAKVGKDEKGEVRIFADTPPPRTRRRPGPFCSSLVLFCLVYMHKCMCIYTI